MTVAYLFNRKKKIVLRTLLLAMGRNSVASAYLSNSMCKITTDLTFEKLYLADAPKSAVNDGLSSCFSETCTHTYIYVCIYVYIYT